MWKTGHQSVVGWIRKYRSKETNQICMKSQIRNLLKTRFWVDLMRPDVGHKKTLDLITLLLSSLLVTSDKRHSECQALLTVRYYLHRSFSSLFSVSYFFFSWYRWYLKDRLIRQTPWVICYLLVFVIDPTGSINNIVVCHSNSWVITPWWRWPRR